MKKNKQIYCKIIDIPKEKNISNFVVKLLSKRPPTYDAFNTQQCKKNTNRSLYEILTLINSRYKNYSIKDLIKLLIDLNSNNLFSIIYCTQLKKFVVATDLIYKSNKNLITNYTYKNFYNITDKDDISIKFIKNIYKQYLNKDYV